jgi:hypothetical protein
VTGTKEREDATVQLPAPEVETEQPIDEDELEDDEDVACEPDEEAHPMPGYEDDDCR